MAVTPCYELDIPAPYSDFFVNEEKAISCAPDFESAPARTNFHMAAWTFLEGGEYRMRVVAVHSSSWATSVTQNNARVFFYTKRDIGPHETVIFLPRGRQRIDLICSNLSLDDGPCFIAFSLWRQERLVYSSTAAGWVFNNSVIADEEVPGYEYDHRQSYPVFAILPNWQEPVIERVRYSTEIFPSEVDLEQRRSLRVVARRSFEASFLRTKETRTKIDSIIAGTGMNQLLLPIWHEVFVLTTPLTDNLVLPAGSLAEREFSTGMYCLVTLGQSSNYEIIKISDADVITDIVIFEDSPVKTWPAGSRIYPMRTARVIDSTQLENRTDNVGLCTIRFEIADSENLWFDPQWGEDQVDDRLFRFKINWASAPVFEFDRTTANVVDDEFGPIDVYDTEQQSRLTVRGNLQFRTRSSLHIYRQFIDRARGRAVRFWMPGQTTDFELLDATDSFSIDIRSIGFTDYFRTYQRFRAAVVFDYHDQTRDKTYVYIESVEDVSDTVERIYFKDSVAASVLSEIRRVSYVFAVRFDQDTFELQHSLANCEAVTVPFVVKSTDDREMELPNQRRASLTSLIYPLELIDSIRTVPLGRSLFLREFPMEPLQAGVELRDFQLNDIIKTITDEPQELQVEVNFRSMELNEIIKTITDEPYAIDVTTACTGMTLNTIIIIHTDPAEDEGFDVGVTVRSMTLGTP